MSVLNLIWLFFLLTALQPVLRQKFLEAGRQRLIRRIEQKHGSRLILLVHRQETMSLLGFPLLRYIDITDSEEIIRAIDLTDAEVPVDLVLHTPGGLVLASLQIARAIQRRKGKTTVYVPHYAMSGGTLIALAADEIVMAEHAVLGPVDPQVGQYPAASLLKVVKQKPIARIDDETLILADQAEKAEAQVRAALNGLLLDKLSPEKAGEVADLLTHGKWTHDFPLTCEDMRGFGLTVRTEMPEEIIKLMGLYPQPVRRMPTVEYSPGRRTTPPAGPDAE
jgi:ClpP class serine protease